MYSLCGGAIYAESKRYKVTSSESGGGGGGLDRGIIKVMDAFIMLVLVMVSWV